MSPTKNGEILDQDAFRKLPDKERKKIQRDMVVLQADIEKIIHQVPRIRRAIQRKVKDLNQSVTRAAVIGLVEDVKSDFQDQPAVLDYLNRVLEDVVEYAEELFLSKEASGGVQGGGQVDEAPAFNLTRYRVNLLVDHRSSKGCPVLYEDNPCYKNLLGRVEHLSHMGTLLTDFTLIKPGILHQANGGYLVIDAMQPLQQPLRGILSSGACGRGNSIESLGQSLSLVNGIPEPEPIPLDIKIVLVGDRMLYYLLHDLDRVSKFFKVAVDFSDQMDRTTKNIGLTRVSLLP